MEWHFRGISDDPDLTHWESRPYSSGVEQGPRPQDNRDNHQRVMGHEAPGMPENDGIARHLADAIQRFDVFPPHLLTGVLRRTPIENGDVIGLRYAMMPGLKLFFAARVYERFDDADERLWRCGFSYRTLDGHPECGEETFIVEKDLVTGAVTAALRSWSRPGIWLAKLSYPLMRAWQLRACRHALDHWERMAHAHVEAAAK